MGLAQVSMVDLGLFQSAKSLVEAGEAVELAESVRRRNS